MIIIIPINFNNLLWDGVSTIVNSNPRVTSQSVMDRKAEFRCQHTIIIVHQLWPVPLQKHNILYLQFYTNAMLVHNDTIMFINNSST